MLTKLRKSPIGFPFNPKQCLGCANFDAGICQYLKLAETKQTCRNFISKELITNEQTKTAKASD